MGLWVSKSGKDLIGQRFKIFNEKKYDFLNYQKKVNKL